MTLFFTADSHFTYKDFDGVVARDGRPFSSCKNNNKKIIKHWNKQAKKGDIIYHLGDFINFNSKDSENFTERFALVKKIKADVVLILGNNEERLLQRQFGDDFEKFKIYLQKLGFKDVVRGGLWLTLSDGDASEKVYLTHMPKNHIDGALNLFGHIHSTVKIKPYGFNVGVDVNHFHLQSESDILRLSRDRVKFDENVYN